LQVISPDETVELDGTRVVHFDCRRPRSLSREERVLLARYCSDHAVGRCASCSLSYRQHQLVSDVFGHDTRLCPRCRKDLTDSVRSHLYACTMLPAEVRGRARGVRRVALGLVTLGSELRDGADLLAREAEVVIVALRTSMSESAAGALRELIHSKLRDGALPHDGIPATVAGPPGDGSTCKACDRTATGVLMMVAPHRGGLPPHAAGSIALHGDCFQIWNAERHAFQANRFKISPKEST
jgi:hypothetical protein